MCVRDRKREKETERHIEPKGNRAEILNPISIDLSTSQSKLQNSEIIFQITSLKHLLSRLFLLLTKGCQKS